MTKKTEDSSVAVAKIEPKSVLVDMATRYGMEPHAFELTVRATCLPPDKEGKVASKEEFAAFLLVAKQYSLNPLTKQIYGIARKGRILPIVSVDGWAQIINDHPAFDGLEFDDHINGKDLTAVTARIWRKDRAKPTVVTEYLAECRQDTDVWKRWPRRMLRHKALIQCARYAFALSGIIDPDEADRYEERPTKQIERPAGPPMPPKAEPISQAEAEKLAGDGGDGGEQVIWDEDGVIVDESYVAMAGK